MLETALDKEGLIYYDKKSKGYIDKKVLAEETRAKEVENDLELKKAPLESPTLTGIPTAPTASTDTNTTQIATTAFVQTAVSNLVDSAPETLNTLNELSSALGDDPNFATTIATQLGNKVDKVSGKGLSTNDYTTTEKTKLESIDTGAEVNQNAFSNVVVGSTTIAADAKTDSLTLAAGDNVTITPDENTNKITISSTGGSGEVPDGVTYVNLDETYSEIEEIESIGTASLVTYDNTNSKLLATTVQDAIDEVNEQITTNQTEIDTISKKCEWKDCIVTANSEVGYFYKNGCKAKYRYDSNGDVLELCVRGTYVSRATITKSTTLMTVSGLDIAISANCTSLIWDDTGKIWNTVTLNTNGNIKLTANTDIKINSWVSCDTLNFVIFFNVK